MQVSGLDPYLFAGAMVHSVKMDNATNSNSVHHEQ